MITIGSELAAAIVVARQMLVALSRGSTRRAFTRYDLPAKPAGAVLRRVRLELVQERVRNIGVDSPKTATTALQIPIAQ